MWRQMQWARVLREFLEDRRNNTAKAMSDNEQRTMR